jgi:uncharacterized protein (TIGR02611 family)
MGKFRDFIKDMVSFLPNPLRWLAITTLGFIVVIIGIIMLPLPGPGTLIIFLGITILALEFEWAREVSTKGEQGLEKIVRLFKEKILKQKPQDNE